MGNITTGQLNPGTSDTLLSADELPNMLTKIEGVSPVPYLDSQGIPTIGIGVNLRVASNLALVLQDLSAVVWGQVLKYKI